MLSAFPEYAAAIGVPDAPRHAEPSFADVSVDAFAAPSSAATCVRSVARLNRSSRLPRISVFRYRRSTMRLEGRSPSIDGRHMVDRRGPMCAKTVRLDRWASAATAHGCAEHHEPSKSNAPEYLGAQDRAQPRPRPRAVGKCSWRRVAGGPLLGARVSVWGRIAPPRPSRP